jgi:hypothetical protein
LFRVDTDGNGQLAYFYEGKIDRLYGCSTGIRADTPKPPGHIPRYTRQHKAEQKAKVIAYLTAHPRRTKTEVARALDVSIASAQHYLQELRSIGVLEIVPVNGAGKQRAFRYYVNKAA